MKYIIKSPGTDIAREVTPIPTFTRPAEDALSTLQSECAKLKAKAGVSGLNRDDAYKLSVYVKAMKELHELNKQLRKDSELENMPLSALRDLAAAVLEKLKQKENEDGTDQSTGQD
jgi:hypothetical protein